MGGFPAGVAGALVAAVAASLVAFAPAANADDQVTVRGTDFPGPAAAALSFAGCAALYDRTAEQPKPYISRGNAPTGRRSLGYDLAGGNAVGSLHVVSSMLATRTASLAVHAPQGATGVAYAGYQEPGDAGTDLMWFGRADLVAPAGQWTTVEATELDYTWTKYDVATDQVVDSGTGVPTTVSSFLAQRLGDGPGLYTIGFGCDGQPFTMDALRVGSPGSVTTYDLEGLTSSVTGAAVTHLVAPGEKVTIRGVVRSGSGSRIPHATLILERRMLGSQEWEQIRVTGADPADARVILQPRSTALYRWRFADRPAHEGSVSPVFAIAVKAPAGLPPAPDPTPSPTPSPAPAPDPSPSPSPDPSPSPTPAPTPSPSPSDESSPNPSPSPSEEPSPSADTSDEPSPSSSPTAVESAAESLTL